MIQKHLLLIDENPQKDTLKTIKDTLRKDGIDLVYEEINPKNYTKRASDGNVGFDTDKFKSKIESIDYFRYADLILTDYNLIKDVINGYEIINIIRELNFDRNKKMILYSAKIDTVISEILKTDSDFELQKFNLINLISNNIEFIKRDGYLEEVIKAIKAQPDFDFEQELIKWFYKRDKDVFNYLFPKYSGRSFGEIAKEIEANSQISIEFKKDLIEQIIAYLVTINGLEND